MQWRRPTRSSFLTVVLVLLSVHVHAERYRVTESSFGETDAESVDTPQEKTLANDVGKIQFGRAVKPESENESSEPSLADSLNGQEVGDKSIDVEQAESPKAMGIFEQKYLEAEKKNRAKVVDNLLRNKGRNPFDATVVDEQEYVDAEAVEQGRVAQDPSKSPYFIQVDAQGRVTTQAYDPNLEKAFAESQRKKKYAFTEATIYTRTDDAASEEMLEGADPVAKNILFGKSSAPTSYFESFSDSCCESILFDKKNILEAGLSYFFELNDDDLSYRFQEGDSRYVLVKLPVKSGKNYPLRVRSFIRQYKDKGIKHGVFFPQLVTLDKEKKPLRIITGPLLKYVPETWMKYGYLEGMFDIDQTEDREETYVLINTTRKIQKQSSVIELKDDSIAIEHMNQGSIELVVHPAL